MNYRFTLALLLVLAALGGALAFADQQKKEEPLSETESQLEVFQLKTTDIQRLEVRLDGQTRLFEKSEGGEWTLQPKGEAVDQVKVSSAVARLAGLRATRRIPSTEVDAEAFGLGSPQLTLEIGLKDGAAQGLEIGTQTPVQTGYYARTAAGGDVYVLASLTVSELERLVEQPFPPTPTPAPPTPTATIAPTAPPISEPSPTPNP